MLPNLWAALGHELAKVVDPAWSLDAREGMRCLQMCGDILLIREAELLLRVVRHVFAKLATNAGWQGCLVWSASKCPRWHGRLPQAAAQRCRHQETTQAHHQAE